MEPSIFIQSTAYCGHVLWHKAVGLQVPVRLLESWAGRASDGKVIGRVAPIFHDKAAETLGPHTTLRLANGTISSQESQRVLGISPWFDCRQDDSDQRLAIAAEAFNRRCRLLDGSRRAFAARGSATLLQGVCRRRPRARNGVTRPRRYLNTTNQGNPTHGFLPTDKGALRTSTMAKSDWFARCVDNQNVNNVMAKCLVVIMTRISPKGFPCQPITPRRRGLRAELGKSVSTRPFKPGVARLQTVPGVPYGLR